MSGYHNQFLKHDFAEIGKLAGIISRNVPITPGVMESLRSLYMTEEYVAHLLTPSEDTKSRWRARTEVQLTTHPYLRGVRSTVERFVDLVALVDKSLNETDAFDEFGGYGYINDIAAFAKER